jgi:tRNA pseudouridine-54 N-methylase
MSGITLDREFLLFSRLGKTSSLFTNLHDAGRLDITYECIVASFFLSHGLRKNVTFHSILNGPPHPPLHLQIDGHKLFDVRTDVWTWQKILKKVLSGKPHPGITIRKQSFESLLKEKAKEKKNICSGRGWKENKIKRFFFRLCFCIRRPYRFAKKNREFCTQIWRQDQLG